MSAILLTPPPCDFRSVTDTYWEVSQAEDSLDPSLYTVLVLTKPHSTTKLPPAAFVLNRSPSTFFF